MVLQGFGIAIVAGLIGEVIQAIVSIDDFQRGVLTGFLATTIFYVFILTGNKKTSD